jgi:hypothetical protein
VEELRMHLAWRWFTGLGFDQEIPHHSTFWLGHESLATTQKYLEPSKETKKQLEDLKLPF